MFNLFRKKHEKKSDLQFADLNGVPLHEGDTVISLRYDLGKCIIRKTAEGMIYESVSTGQKISWAKMIDAATKNQKVLKELK